MATTEQIPATHSADAWEAALAALDVRAEHAAEVLRDVDRELARRWPDGTADAEEWRALMRPRVERRARAWIALAAAVRAELDRRGPRGASARFGAPDLVAHFAPEGPHGDPTPRSARGQDASLTTARDRYVRGLLDAIGAWVARWGPRRRQRPVPLLAPERMAIVGHLELLGEHPAAAARDVARMEREVLAGTLAPTAGRGWAHEIAAELLDYAISAHALKKIGASHASE